jgi:hypothetical protein
MLRRKLEAEPTVVAGIAFENHERLTPTLRFRQRGAHQRRADPTALVFRRDGQWRQGQYFSPPSGIVDQVRTAEHHEARNSVADPGDQRQARPEARRYADRRDHVGHLWAVGERASHDVIDRGVIGVLLGVDNEVVHSPTLDRTSPRMRLVITLIVLRSGAERPVPTASALIGMWVNIGMPRSGRQITSSVRITRRRQGARKRPWSQVVIATPRLVLVMVFASRVFVEAGR